MQIFRSWLNNTWEETARTHARTHAPAYARLSTCARSATKQRACAHRAHTHGDIGTVPQVDHPNKNEAGAQISTANGHQHSLYSAAAHHACAVPCSAAHVYVYIYKHVHTWVYTYLDLQTCVYRRACADIHVQTCVWTCMRRHVFSHVCIQICVYRHACRHA